MERNTWFHAGARNFVTIFRKILSRNEEARQKRQRKRQHEDALNRAIDQVAKTSAPVICFLHNCRHELRAPVEAALDYIQKTMDAIPGPVDLTPSNWGRDRLLQTLFINDEEIQNLLMTSHRLQAFFEKDKALQTVALLTATKRERTIFGTAMEGDILRRDVAQTAVEFYDHRIMDPSAAAADTQRALRDRALNALVTHTLERLLKIRALKDELKEQQRLLSIQFRIQQTRMQGLDVLESDETDRQSTIPAESLILTDIEKELQELGEEADCPEEYLRQLTAVLNAPQQVLTVAPIRLHLNWMGVKQGDDGAEGEDAPSLAEVAFQGRPKRVAVFVTIARKDCLRVP
jgi:hypothetical protein